MIKDENLARQVSELMLDLSARIRQSVAPVGKYSAEDMRAYEKGLKKVLATIDAEVLAPLYAEHSSLRPAGWKRTESLPGQSRSLGGIIQPV